MFTSKIANLTSWTPFRPNACTSIDTHLEPHVSTCSSVSRERRGEWGLHVYSSMGRQLSLPNSCEWSMESNSCELDNSPTLYVWFIQRGHDTSTIVLRIHTRPSRADSHGATNAGSLRGAITSRYDEQPAKGVELFRCPIQAVTIPEEVKEECATGELSVTN